MKGIIVRENRIISKFDLKDDWSDTKEKVRERIPDEKLGDKILYEKELDLSINEIRIPARPNKWSTVDENGHVDNSTRPPTYHYELEGELLGQKEVDIKGFHRKLSESEEKELEEKTDKKIVEIRKTDERMVEKPVKPNDPKSEKDLFRETYTETIDDRRENKIERKK